MQLTEPEEGEYSFVPLSPLTALQATPLARVGGPPFAPISCADVAVEDPTLAGGAEISRDGGMKGDEEGDEEGMNIVAESCCPR